MPALAAAPAAPLPLCCCHASLSMGAAVCSWVAINAPPQVNSRSLPHQCKPLLLDTCCSCTRVCNLHKNSTHKTQPLAVQEPPINLCSLLGQFVQPSSPKRSPPCCVSACSVAFTRSRPLVPPRQTTPIQHPSLGLTPSWPSAARPFSPGISMT